MKRIITLVMLISVMFGMFTYVQAKDCLPMIVKSPSMVYDQRGVQLGMLHARDEICAVDVAMTDDTTVWVIFIWEEGGWFSDDVYGLIDGFKVVKK